MKLITTWLLLAAIATTTIAAAQNKSPAGSKTARPGDVMPQPGYDLTNYIGEHIHYPDSARRNNIEGKVLVKFVVMEDGSIASPAVVRSLSADCDAEALRVISSMPPWHPGLVKGKPAKVAFTQPISFKLSDHPAKKFEGSIFTYVEEMPAPGYDINKYLAENLHYPKDAASKGVEGRVIVKFVVTETGSIEEAVVQRGIGSGCDEEALRVISNMPHWKPGKQNGKPVNVYFVQPMYFRLGN